MIQLNRNRRKTVLPAVFLRADKNRRRGMSRGGSSLFNFVQVKQGVQIQSLPKIGYLSGKRVYLSR